MKVIGSDGDNGPVEHAHERDDCLAAAARVDAVAAGVHHTIGVLHEHTSKEVELVGRQAREDVVGRHEEGVAPARATVTELGSWGVGETAGMAPIAERRRRPSPATSPTNSQLAPTKERHVLEVIAEPGA